MCIRDSVYLSLADLSSHEITEADLRALVDGCATADIHSRWHALVHDICARAHIMRGQGAAMARSAWDALPSDCSFIFRLIVGMYSELLDRIDADPDCVLRPEPVLKDADKTAMVQAAAAASGYQLQSLRNA